MDMPKVIDKAKEKLGVESDYALAKKLDIPNPRISEYRSGKARPDAYACARLAEVLDMDPFELLAQVEAATEKNEARRSYWRAVAERIAAGTVAGFFVVAVLANDVGLRLLTVFRSSS
jgi:transcriptional regulator with XRE-family HTH domain